MAVADLGSQPWPASTAAWVTNVAILSLGWCLAASALFIQISNATLAAAALASPGVSTYPLAAYTLCSAATALPGTLALSRFGRKPVFLCGVSLACLGAGLEILALYHKMYGVLILGAALQGPSFALANNYRFAAAEFAPPKHRPRAISAVVLGGVAVAALGPEAARHLRNALPIQFAGAFVLLIGLYFVHLLALLCINYKLLKKVEQYVLLGTESGTETVGAAAEVGKQPQQKQQEQQFFIVTDEVELKCAGSEGTGIRGKADTETGNDSLAPAAAAAATGVGKTGDKGWRAAPEPALGGPGVQDSPLLSFKALLWNVEFVVAALTAGLCFAGMAALMSVTPVTMVGVGHSIDAATWVVEVHVVAMYLPGLFTGDLMRLTGAPAMMVLGVGSLLLGNGAFLMGSAAWVYFLGMALLGLGWNAAYVAASFTVSGVYSREPRRRLTIQGSTDTLVITLTGIAIGTSSSIHTALGWHSLVLIYIGVHGFLICLDLWYWSYRVCVSRRGKERGVADSMDSQLLEL